MWLSEEGGKASDKAQDKTVPGWGGVRKDMEQLHEGGQRKVGVVSWEKGQGLGHAGCAGLGSIWVFWSEPVSHGGFCAEQ